MFNAICKFNQIHDDFQDFLIFIQHRASAELFRLYISITSVGKSAASSQIGINCVVYREFSSAGTGHIDDKIFYR
jgi:hypothetical protein